MFSICSRNTPRISATHYNVMSSVRFQSSSKSPNLNRLKANVTTKSKTNEYNALSNHNLTNQAKEASSRSHTQKPAINKPLNTKLLEKKKYKCPKVPSTSYLEPEYVAIDALYAGFRPLAMKDLKKHLLPSRKWYADRPGAACWSISAGGLENFPEWDELYYEDYSNLYPFRPPTSEKVSKRGENQENVNDPVYGTASQTSRSVNSSQKLKLRRGRVKPAAMRLLHKKKK